MAWPEPFSWLNRPYTISTPVTVRMALCSHICCDRCSPASRQRSQANPRLLQKTAPDEKGGRRNTSTEALTARGERWRHGWHRTIGPLFYRRSPPPASWFLNAISSIKSDHGTQTRVSSLFLRTVHCLLQDFGIFRHLDDLHVGLWRLCIAAVVQRYHRARTCRITADGSLVMSYTIYQPCPSEDWDLYIFHQQQKQRFDAD